jgi:Holliday junction resolvase RusA-like endonuclease
MNQDIRKPIIGFTCGDLNGIGIELIIKSLSDSRLLEFMVPVIFANHKAINFYSKSSPNFQMSFSTAPDLDKLIRAVLDSMTAIAYLDDGQVTEINAVKVYGTAPFLEVGLWRS